MTSYEFYVCKYGGKAIQPDEWQTAYADADALIRRYERLYRVEYPTDSARNTAVCAIADAQRRFADVQSGAAAAPASVTIGSVSESYAANTAAAIDATPKAQAAEYYRILCLYADWYKVGQLIGEKLRDSLNAIPWPDIQDKAVQWATNIADCINGFIEVPGLWTAIGHAEAKADSTGNGGQKRQDQTCALFIRRTHGLHSFTASWICGHSAHTWRRPVRSGRQRRPARQRGRCHTRCAR